MSRSRTASRDRTVEWRTLDSATLHRAVVAYSETYNQLLADEVTRRTGLGWEQRERGGRGRRPARELAGVPDALIAAFSQRSADIEAAVDTAIDRTVQTTGRHPSTRSLNRIRQHITLATRDRKKATSLSAAVAGLAGTPPGRPWEPIPPSGPATSPAGAQRTRGDAARRRRAGCPGRQDGDPGGGRGGRLPGDVDQVEPDRGDHAADHRGGMAVHQHRRHRRGAGPDRHGGPGNSPRTLSAGELAAVPDAFRDPDGASQFARPTVFTSTKVLAAEDMLLTLAADQSGPDGAADPGATALLRNLCPAAGTRCPVRIRRRPRWRW